MENKPLNKEQKRNVGGGEVEPRLGLAPDYLNAWMALGNYLQAMKFKEELAEHSKQYLLNHEVPTYENYISSHYGDTAEHVLNDPNRNPQKIEEVNTLVRQFNQERQELLNNKSLAKLQEFWNKIDFLVRGKEYPRK